MDSQNNFLNSCEQIRRSLKANPNFDAFLNKLENSKNFSQELLSQAPSQNDPYFTHQYYLIFLGKLIKNKCSFARIYKNIQVIKDLKGNQHFQPLIASFIDLILKYPSYSIWTKVNKLLIIKDLNIPKQIEPLLKEINEKLFKAIKKIHRYCQIKKILKYLSICIFLAQNAYFLKHQISELVIYSVKALEFKYNLHRFVNVEKKIELISDYDDGILIKKMLDYLKDRGDIIQNLINFTNVQPLEGLLHDYNQKVKLFPPKISKKHLLSDFDINQLSNSMIFCSQSGLASLCTYSYTIINQFSFNVNYFSSSVENIAAELETLNKIKSHTNGSHCLPLLIHHNNYDSYITMFFEVYPMNFMVYLSNNLIERKSINELQLFKWSKSLIKSFAILESLDIVHGNVTPHNIYINSEFKLKIYNFKSHNPRVRTSYPSPENLIQDSCGYYPENNEFIDDTKHDVFALGLVLLQIYDYESIVNLNFDQNLINSRISRVSYQWLEYLLNYMLNLNAEQRPTFNQLKDIIKN